MRLAGQTGIHERSRIGCKGYPCTESTVVVGALENEYFDPPREQQALLARVISYERLRARLRKAFHTNA